jgi:hypothetical protein
MTTGTTNYYAFRVQLLLLVLLIFEVVEETFSFTSSTIPYRSTSVCRIPTIYSSSSSEYYRDDDKDYNSATTSPSLSTIPEDPITTYTNSASTSASSVWHVWTAADHLEQSINDNNDDDDDDNNNNNTHNNNHNHNHNNTSSSSSYYLYPASKTLIRTVISILRTLGTQHDGKKEWQGILNKSTLLHEIEESILAIHFLQRELFLSSSSSSPSSKGTTITTTTSATQKEVIIVDACCGKGVFSLLCSYVFQQQRQENTISDDDNDRGDNNCNYTVRKIIMLDNDADLKWNHVDATNNDNNNNDAAITKNNNRRPIIECWSRCNLHEIDTMVDRLSQEVQVVVQQQRHQSEEKYEDEDESISSSSSSLSTTTKTLNAINSPPILAVVGIHLCKTLSPTCIGIVNALGPTICPLLVLAPCCLPRSVIRPSKLRSNNLVIDNKKSSTIEIRQYETPEERDNRNIAKIRRDAAMLRGKKGRGEKKNAHIIRPMTRGDQAIAILSHNDDDDDDDNNNNNNNNSSNAANECCWKCGENGHVKANCPSKQSTGKPQLILPPQLILDVSDVFLKREEEEERPFLSYCKLLRTSIQRSHVLVEETDLNNKHEDDTKIENNNKSKKNSHNNKNKNQTNNWNNERKSVYIVART